MSGKKLLVADDSLTIQKVIRLALSNDGYEIQTVSEGNEAIEQILLFRPKVVLIDVTLPGKSAIEVKAAIASKPELAGTQFILMSSAFETIDEAALDKAGFTARLTKPFDPAHLRKLVSEGVALGAPPAMPAAPPAEVPDLLWSPAPEPEAPAPIPASIPMPPARTPMAPPADDSDIRQLTQSTLQMAGLDDLDWSISEPSSKASDPVSAPGIPGLPPLPGFSSGPTLQPPAGLTPASAPSSAASAYFDSPMSSGIAGLGDDLPPPVPSQPAEPQTYALPTDELEALVRQQIEEAIQKISREMLPQIAERILKQEINRLLNEVP